MPPYLALLIGAVFVFFAFRSDRTRDLGNSGGVFLPTLWYVVVATRPLGFWMQLLRLPMPGESGDPIDGSTVDRYFFLALTVIGLRILFRRHFDWGAAFRRNRWLVALLAFMVLSILWSDFPFVSFKRFIKVIGSIIMALVILTHSNPLTAFTAVLRRCLYIHLPMSIICTRYFRDVGVTYEFNGTTQEWVGIATSKNTLGQVTMLGILYFSWQVWRNWRRCGWRNLHLVYLFMGIVLLKGSASISMTSLSVCVFALAIFFRIQSLRLRPASIRPFVITMFSATVALILFVIVHSLVMFSPDSLFGHLITFLGRDITLTGRTYIWSDCYAAASGSPLVGVGFGGFWIGRIANIPWNAHMSWVLGQAHSGYVDTYLQLGFVGVLLLTGVLCTALPDLIASLGNDFDFGCLRITLLLTIVYVNITETIYLRGDHHLWLILMVVLWKVPKRATVGAGRFKETNEANFPAEQVEGAVAYR